MLVARATSPPTRSSMRRSTPAIGDGVQARSAACTATRRVKSALSCIDAYLVAVAGMLKSSGLQRQAPMAPAPLRAARLGAGRQEGLDQPNRCGRRFLLGDMAATPEHGKLRLGQRAGQSAPHPQRDD